MLQPLRPYTSIRSVVVALALLCLGTWITFRTYSHSESAARGSARDARTSRASNSNPAKPDEATRTRVSDAYGKLPLSFEINRGQMSDRVKFLSRGSGYSLFLTSADAVMVLRKTDSAKTSNPQTVIGNQKSALLRMKLIGANRSTLVEGREELPGKSNYFIGNDPTKWQTNVPNYQKVRYSNVYPGIDLVYHGNQRQLEYDFVVAPGANPGLIKLNFHGARRINVDRNGDLVLRTANGEIRQLKPIVYQVVNGERQSINGHYVVRQGNHVAFKIGKYNTNEPLLIDPTLVYSTYLGGSGNDYGNGITADSAGNAYIVGSTYSVNFPVTPGVFQSTNHAPYNAFVMKIDPTGSTLLYSTYLGGTGGGFYNDIGNAIKVDSSGNAYVTGATNSTNFPVTPGAFQSTFAGGGFTGCCFPGDGFVTKLNSTGSTLVYSTYLGGSGWDIGQGIDIDSAGNAYVAGQTHSTNFPVTAGAFQTSFHGSYGCGGNTNSAFVTKLNPTGTGLVYSTYLGGGGFDGARAIAVDGSGSAYVTGFAQSSDFPTTPGSFQPTPPGPTCSGPGFVTKLNAAGSALVYSSYLGGTAGTGYGNGIAVDGAGNAYVAGFWNSPGFPTTAGAIQTTYGGGGNDAFVTKINFAGSALVYSTYLGGANTDDAFALSVDPSGDAFVTGRSYSANFPVTPGALTSSNQGGADVFVTGINPGGTGLLYSSYLGGSSDEYGTGIALDNLGNIYLTGVTGSTNFPTTAGSVQTTNHGGSDAFVTKIGGAVPCASTGTWTTKTSMPTPLTGSVAGVINGQLYVMGGNACSNPAGCGFPPPTAYEAYNPATDTWASKASDPTPRASAGAGAINNKLYVVGGCINTDCASTTNALEVYDPASNTWASLAPMPTARSNMFAGAINGKLYVAGGTLRFLTAFTTLEVYDPVTNTWTTKAPLPVGQAQGTAAVVNGNLYVIGGFDATVFTGGPAFVGNVYAYDPVSDTWSSKATMPTARRSAAAGVVNSLLYVVGGQGSAGILSTNEAYDPLLNSWTTQAAMPTARETLAAGVINSVLYAVGGDNGSVALGTNEAFTSCLTPDLCAGVTCTATDACHVAGVCDPATGLCSNPNAPDGTACNDGNACTQTDTCQSGTCVGSNPVTCAVLDQCHVAGTCDPATGTCSNPAAADGTACSDGDACTQTDTCQAGTCVGSNPVVCTASDQCHTAGTCNPATGQCSNPNAANGTACNDGNACTTSDSCQNGTCIGTTTNCDDNNACTADSCDPATGCAHTPISCDDGNACTTDTCNPATGCTHTPVSCDDNNACTADSCDPATGCRHVAVSCDDNNACTADACDPATGCTHTPVSCDDNNACTADSCDPATGCRHVAVSCDDNNACTADACDPATGCTHTPVSCDDNNACTADACDPATGCTHTPVSCDDNNACTADSCDPATGCRHVAVSCDDSNACTADSCDPATGCVHTPVSCDDGNACTADSCDPRTGCTHTAVSCDDGNACTADSCDPANGCVHTPVSCDDNNACTADSCDPRTGCVHTPVSCDDNNACTADSCDPATGCKHVAVSCDDNNACTADSCDPATGCRHVPVSCDDNNACTADSCDPATGCAHTLISCDDGNPCTVDSCNPTTGCVHFPVCTNPVQTGFVIGDRNAVVGNHVTFWGAQWAKENSLSGASAPSSFKGFADSTTPNPPSCGGSWESDPGNSSGPPATVPEFIVVLVSSKITKSGSVISGNVPEMVVVQTDPGYAPNPGHAGTGTVVAVICQASTAELTLPSRQGEFWFDLYWAIPVRIGSWLSV